MKRNEMRITVYGFNMSEAYLAQSEVTSDKAIHFRVANAYCTTLPKK